MPHSNATLCQWDFQKISEGKNRGSLTYSGEIAAPGIRNAMNDGTYPTMLRGVKDTARKSTGVE